MNKSLFSVKVEFPLNANLDLDATAATDFFGEGVDLESQHLDTAALMRTPPLLRIEFE
uniref:Uncharacterized protein n=1 Tax=Kalanchoe fedtschenkoi TaxID=63787 RepID=A0A7N0TR11_KALFE